MKEPKEELTAKMHSEFTVSKETEIRHKAGSMWSVAGFDSDEGTMKRWCDAYGITIQQALKHKAFWEALSE